MQKPTPRLLTYVVHNRVRPEAFKIVVYLDDRYQTWFTAWPHALAYGFDTRVASVRVTMATHRLLSW